MTAPRAVPGTIMAAAIPNPTGTLMVTALKTDFHAGLHVRIPIMGRAR